MSLQRASKMRDARQGIIEKMQALSARADEEDRALTEEERIEWDRMDDEQEGMRREAERLEREHDITHEADEARRARRDHPGLEDRAGNSSRRDESTDPAEQRARESQAFLNWMRHGINGLDEAERRMMLERRAQVSPEMRAQSTTTTAGGFTIAEDFSNELEIAMLAFGGMREAARIIRTATGAVLPWPEMDDTSNKGAILSENSQDSEQDITFTETQFDAYMYTSNIVRVSLQILQDSAFGFGDLVGNALAERLARITNQHATTGTGSSQPNGVVTASSLGVTAAGETAITHDELLDLKHSVDPAYRARPGVRWMFNDSTLKLIKKLKDANNLPLWQNNVALREPDTIDGDIYTINQDMASLAPLAKTVLYGDFQKYIMREVRDVTLLRLEERYADYLQVGFLAFMRFDSDLVDAGTNPIKHLIHGSG